jgi:hypothetical protein
LLLVAAILVFTISQIGGVIEGYESAVKEAGFTSADQVEATAKSAGLPDPTQATKAEPDKKPKLEKLDLTRANFDPEAAREAAKLAEQDAELLRQIDLSQVDLSKVKFKKGLDLSGIDLSRALSKEDMKKIDFSKVNFGSVPPEQLRQLKPFIAKEAIKLKLQGLKAQAKLKKAEKKAKKEAKKAKADPKLALPQAPAPEPTKPEPPKKPPQRLQVTYIDEVNTLPALQKQELVKALDVLLQQDAKLRIWMQLPTDDVYLKRTAYTRLVALKALAIEAGFAPARVLIDIDILPGMPQPQSEMTFYVDRWNK